MRIRLAIILGLALGIVAGAALPLWAAGQIRLDLIGRSQGSAMAFQDWLQVLGKAGVKNVRFRTGDGTEQVGIDVQGTPQSPLYVVTGMVVSRDELLLPGGRFKRSDAVRVARWLDDVAANGPPERRPKRGAFGLTIDQFEQVHKDTARLVGLSTQGMPRAEAAEKIAHRLQLPLQVERAQWEALGNDRVQEELSSLSCGTALACVLRPAGFCLLPCEVDKRPVYTITKLKPDVQVWPVGWDPPKDKSPHDVLPVLFDFLNINVENVAASQAIEAIGKRLKVPVLMDQIAMARERIDPTKALVSLPKGRTAYGIALRKLLFQAKLKYEVRLDEADQPFLWISTVKPM
jgi:hypothetical protein